MACIQLSLRCCTMLLAEASAVWSVLLFIALLVWACQSLTLGQFDVDLATICNDSGTKALM